MRSKKGMGNHSICSICQEAVLGNVNPERVLTCGKCVQTLLTTSREDKIALIDKLLQCGNTEGARSVESFIAERGNGNIPVFKTSCRKIAFKGSLGRVKVLGNRS